MKLYTVTLEVGVDDNVSEETIREKISMAIAEDLSEAKIFRINNIKKQKVASGEYKMQITEAKRLGITDNPPDNPPKLVTEKPPALKIAQKK